MEDEIEVTGEIEDSFEPADPLPDAIKHVEWASGAQYSCRRCIWDTLIEGDGEAALEQAIKHAQSHEE